MKKSRGNSIAALQIMKKGDALLENILVAMCIQHHKYGYHTIISGVSKFIKAYQSIIKSSISFYISSESETLSHHNITSLLGWCVVKYLNASFKMDVEILDKSANFFPHTAHDLYFTFLVGTTSADFNMAAILAFQDGRYEKITFANNNCYLSFRVTQAIYFDIYTFI